VLTIQDHPDPRVRDLRVIPHNLAPYDQLGIDPSGKSHE
jgi:hypothetical protein